MGCHLVVGELGGGGRGREKKEKEKRFDLADKIDTCSFLIGQFLNKNPLIVNKPIRYFSNFQKLNFNPKFSNVFKVVDDQKDYFTLKIFGFSHSSLLRKFHPQNLSTSTKAYQTNGGTSLAFLTRVPRSFLLHCASPSAP